MTLKYSSNITHSAWFVYTYTAIKYTILSYNDSPHVIWDQFNEHQYFYLLPNIYSPVLSTIQYKTYAWLVKGDVFENIDMQFLPLSNCMSTQLRYGKPDISLFEGPGYHHLIFRGKGMTCDALKQSVFTSKLFQMGLSVKVVANGELGFYAYILRASVIASLKSINIDLIDKQIIRLSLLDHPDCQQADYTRCMWKIRAPLNLYVMTAVKEIQHAAPDPSMCDYLGLSLIPIPQHYRYSMAGPKGPIYQQIGQETIYPHYQHTVMCDQYLHSTSTFKRNIASSTTHMRLLFYSYSMYIAAKFKSSIVVELSASKSQAIPMIKPEVFVFLSTTPSVGRESMEACYQSVQGLVSKRIETKEKDGIHDPSYDPFTLFRLIEQVRNFLIPFGGSGTFKKHGYLAMMSFESGVFCSYHDKNKLGYIFGGKQTVSSIPHLGYVGYKFGKSIQINVLPYVERHGITFQNTLLYIDGIQPLFGTRPSSIFSSYAVELYYDEIDKLSCLNSKKKHFEDIGVTTSYSDFSFVHPIYPLRKPDCFYFTMTSNQSCMKEPIKVKQSEITTVVPPHNLMHCPTIDISLNVSQTTYYQVYYRTIKSYLVHAFEIEKYPSCSRKTSLSVHVSNLIMNGTVVEWRNVEIITFYSLGFRTFTKRSYASTKNVLHNTFTFKINDTSEQCNYTLKQFSTPQLAMGNGLRGRFISEGMVFYAYQTYFDRMHLMSDPHPSKDLRNISWYDAAGICTKNNATVFTYYSEPELLRLMDTFHGLTFDRNPMIIFTNPRTINVSKRRIISFFHILI